MSTTVHDIHSHVQNKGMKNISFCHWGKDPHDKKSFQTSTIDSGYKELTSVNRAKDSRLES